MDQSTFSESWHRVADQRISLRVGVNVQRQFFRGELWVVVEDPFTNQFFRLRPAAYEFVARLRPDKTVDQVWQECLDKFPDDAPGQGEVIQILAQLYQSSLLQYSLAEDAKELFERYRKRKTKEAQARWMQIMFMRIPLIDPDQFLVRTLPLVGKFINAFGAMIWLALVGYALKLVADNFDSVVQETQGVLAPGNIPLLYGAMVIVKVLHEFGHAYFCRKFGGEVHVMGVMLLVFTPIPYMDATSSWRFRSRWQRLLVAAAGMIVEVFVAGIAVIIWANTGDGALHSLAYNMIFVASVSTVIFNLNPLLRFDGYYMLCDLLEIPNLHQRSGRHLKHLSEKYLFNVKQSHSPTDSYKEKTWLTSFGILAAIYRVIVFASILMFVADKFLILGLIMLVIGVATWIIVPTVKMLSYLGSSERLERRRFRAACVSGGIFAIIAALLWFIPFPNHFRAPGVIESKSWAQVIGDTSGFVKTIIAKPGSTVEAGAPLLRLENEELILAKRQTEARLDELDKRIKLALERSAANLKPLRDLKGSVQERLDRIDANIESLTVRARMKGTWVAPGVEHFQGRWFERGAPLGMLVDESGYQFVATVDQADADRLFTVPLQEAQVRLHGQAEAVQLIRNITVVPGEQSQLPSAALGWAAGGEVATKMDDPQGRRAAEPFYRVSGDLSGSEGGLIHGRTGKVRFYIGHEPLLKRWIRRFWQLLQERYQV